MAELLTQHAHLRTEQMGLTTAAVQTVVLQPEITYPSPPEHGPGRFISVRDELAVVHTADRQLIITVLWRGRTGRD